MDQHPHRQQQQQQHQQQQHLYQQQQQQQQQQQRPYFQQRSVSDVGPHHHHHLAGVMPGSGSNNLDLNMVAPTQDLSTFSTSSPAPTAIPPPSMTSTNDSLVGSSSRVNTIIHSTGPSSASSMSQGTNSVGGAQPPQQPAPTSASTFESGSTMFKTPTAVLLQRQQQLQQQLQQQHRLQQMQQMQQQQPKQPDINPVAPAPILMQAPSPNPLSPHNVSPQSPQTMSAVSSASALSPTMATLATQSPIGPPPKAPLAKLSMPSHGPIIPQPLTPTQSSTTYPAQSPQQGQGSKTPLLSPGISMSQSFPLPSPSEPKPNSLQLLRQQQQLLQQQRQQQQQQQQLQQQQQTPPPPQPPSHPAPTTPGQPRPTQQPSSAPQPPHYAHSQPSQSQHQSSPSQSVVHHENSATLGYQHPSSDHTSHSELSSQVQTRPNTLSRHATYPSPSSHHSAPTQQQPYRSDFPPSAIAEPGGHGNRESNKDGFDPNVRGLADSEERSRTPSGTGTGTFPRISPPPPLPIPQHPPAQHHHHHHHYHQVVMSGDPRTGGMSDMSDNRPSLEAMNSDPPPVYSGGPPTEESESARFLNMPPPQSHQQYSYPPRPASPMHHHMHTFHSQPPQHHPSHLQQHQSVKQEPREPPVDQDQYEQEIIRQPSSISNSARSSAGIVPVGPSQIFKATYSGVPVFEMICKGVAVMRRRSDSYLNATQILKVADFDKPQRTRILEREVQKGEHEKVQGGYGKYQGTWVPFERGVQLCREYNVIHLLQPLIDYQATKTSPPLAPKHLTAASNRPRKPRESRLQEPGGELGPGREGKVRRRRKQHAGHLLLPKPLGPDGMPISVSGLAAGGENYDAGPMHGEGGMSANEMYDDGDGSDDDDDDDDDSDDDSDSDETGDDDDDDETGDDDDEVDDDEVGTRDGEDDSMSETGQSVTDSQIDSDISMEDSTSVLSDFTRTHTRTPSPVGSRELAPPLPLPLPPPPPPPPVFVPEAMTPVVVAPLAAPAPIPVETPPVIYNARKEREPEDGSGASSSELSDVGTYSSSLSTTSATITAPARRRGRGRGRGPGRPRGHRREVTRSSTEISPSRPSRKHGRPGDELFIDYRGSRGGRAGGTPSSMTSTPAGPEPRKRRGGRRRMESGGSEVLAEGDDMSQTEDAEGASAANRDGDSDDDDDGNFEDENGEVQTEGNNRRSLRSTSQDPRQSPAVPSTSSAATMTSALAELGMGHLMESGGSSSRGPYADALLEYFVTDSDRLPSVLTHPPSDLDINLVIDGEDHTALHWAAAMAKIEAATTLIQTRAADAFRLNTDGQTALMRSVLFTNNYEEKTFPALLDLLQKTIFAIDTSDQTVFHHVINAATTAITKARTELAEAATNTSEAEVPSTAPATTPTPVSPAVVASKTRLRLHAARYYLETLLQKLSPHPSELASVINGQDSAGDTALILAARSLAQVCSHGTGFALSSSRKIVRLLMDSGADTQIQNRTGKSAEEYLVEAEEAVEAAAAEMTALKARAATNSASASVSASATPITPEIGTMPTSKTAGMAESTSSMQAELGTPQGLEGARLAGIHYRPTARPEDDPGTSGEATSQPQQSMTDPRAGSAPVYYPRPIRRMNPFLARQPPSRPIGSHVGENQGGLYRQLQAANSMNVTSPTSGTEQPEQERPSKEDGDYYSGQDSPAKMIPTVSNLFHRLTESYERDIFDKGQDVQEARLVLQQVQAEIEEGRWAIGEGRMQEQMLAHARDQIKQLEKRIRQEVELRQRLRIEELVTESEGKGKAAMDTASESKGGPEEKEEDMDGTNGESGMELSVAAEPGFSLLPGAAQGQSVTGPLETEQVHPETSMSEMTTTTTTTMSSARMLEFEKEATFLRKELRRLQHRRKDQTEEWVRLKSQQVTPVPMSPTALGQGPLEKQARHSQAEYHRLIALCCNVSADKVDALIEPLLASLDKE